MPDDAPPAAPAADAPPAKPAAPAADAPPPAATVEDKPLGDAGEKALEAMKVRARDAEKEAKAAKAELDKLRKAQMTEQEQAVAAAREEGKAEATSAVVQRLAAAEIKAALTGVVPDPTAIVEELNLARYVGDDGEVDAEKVAALKAKYEGITSGQAPPPPPPPPGVPKGARPSTSEVKQLTHADLKGMTPAQVVEARKAGQFADLMSGARPT